MTTSSHLFNVNPSYLSGFELVEVLDSTPGNVHKLPRKRDIQAHVVYSREGTVISHVGERVRYTSFPIEHLPMPGVEIGTCVRDCSRDVGLLKPGLLKYLKRPLFQSTKGWGERAWLPGGHLQVGNSLQVEHPQPYHSDTRITSVETREVCNCSAT